MSEKKKQKQTDCLVRILDKYSSEFNTRKGWKANDKCPDIGSKMVCYFKTRKDHLKIEARE